MDGYFKDDGLGIEDIIETGTTKLHFSFTVSCENDKSIYEEAKHSRGPAVSFP